MSGEDLDWIARAGAKAKGERPRYFDDPAVDRVLSIAMAVAGEVAVLRERLDTVERLLEAKGTLTRADIEAYQPDRQAGRERGLLHKAFIARVLRGVQQDAEAIAEAPPSVDAVIDALREG